LSWNIFFFIGCEKNDRKQFIFSSIIFFLDLTGFSKFKTRVLKVIIIHGWFCAKFEEKVYVICFYKLRLYHNTPCIIINNRFSLFIGLIKLMELFVKRPIVGLICITRHSIWRTKMIIFRYFDKMMIKYVLVLKFCVKL